MLTLDLPWPPTTNNLYSTQGRKRVLKPEARMYKERVAWYCRRIMTYTAKIAGRISLTIDLFPPDKRRIDIDNRLKIVLDALTDGGIWSDDSQVDEIFIKRFNVVEGGKVFVTVDELKDA